jgi:hypothetical protein
MSKEIADPFLNKKCEICYVEEKLYITVRRFKIKKISSVDLCPVAIFIVRLWLWGDKVDSGIGLSYRPATLCSLEGRHDNPIPE